MIVDIHPSTVHGNVTPPPSKSILHRAIISACVAKGTSIIENVVFSEDVLATLGAFKQLGVDILVGENRIEITSSGLPDIDQELEVLCNESGSTIRFLIPLLSNRNKVYFKGKSSLLKRPFSIYEELYSAQGLDFKATQEGIVTQGRLSPGNYHIRGDVSSQFISGLLFLLPLLTEDSTIEVTGRFESSDYVDITISVLKSFGINIEKSGQTFFIKGNQAYKPAHYIVETDYSQLAFYVVLGIINNSLNICINSENSLQPDRLIIDIVERMGGRVVRDNNSINVYPSETHGLSIDLSQSPDIGPILGILAACSKGTTTLLNAKRLVLKESNRLKTTHDILKQLGADVHMGEDWLKITGPTHFRGGLFDSYNDHRIAMSLAVAATVALDPITILNADAVRKSYPDFYKDLQSLGAVIKYR